MAYKATVRIDVVKDDQPHHDVTANYYNMEYADMQLAQSTVINSLVELGNVGIPVSSK